jgi:hypothetical protein
MVCPFHQQVDNFWEVQHENAECGGILIHVWGFTGFYPTYSAGKIRHELVSSSIVESLFTGFCEKTDEFHNNRNQILF